MKQPTTEQIRELAEKVIWNGNQEYGNPNWYGMDDDWSMDIIDSDDQAFICAITPATIVELLDRIQAADTQRRELLSLDRYSNFVRADNGTWIKYYELQSILESKHDARSE